MGHNLVGAISRPYLGAANTEADISGQILAKAGGFPVGVAVKTLGSLGNSLGHVLAHRLRWRIRIFVDVQAYRDVKLRSPVWLCPDKFGAQRKIRQLDRVRLRLSHRTGLAGLSMLSQRDLLTVMALAWPGKFSAKAKASTESASSSRASSV